LVFEIELTERAECDAVIDSQSAISAGHALDAQWTVAIEAIGADISIVQSNVNGLIAS